MALTADLRYATRLLLRSPIFTITSIASLAIGIGAAAAIYSLSDALLFEQVVGVRNPSEVVDIGRSNEGSGFDNMSHPVFQYLKDHSQTLVGMSSVDFGGGPLSFGENGSSERIMGTLVSGNYFDVLGTRAALGRFFRADEDAVPGERPVLVLSHAFWKRRFNSDPNILQRQMRVNNRDFAIVGVAEEGFQGAGLIGTDVWMPVAMVAVARGRSDSNMLTDPGGVWHIAIGRRKPGVSNSQVQAELNTLMAQFKASESRVNEHHTIAVLTASRLPAPVRLPFLAFIGFLFALTGSLVAIACSNVAGMLLARATVRRREMATRLAVGADRRQLIKQLLTETIVLFAAAGLVALPITLGLINGLESLLPNIPLAINLDMSLNSRVILFSIAMALTTAVIFGLAPARHALGGDLAPMLHGANATADRRRFRMRNTLVVAQVALSLMLVITAFLFLRTLQNAATTDPGFQTANIDVANVDVSLSGYHDQAAVALAQRFQERLSAISGVTSVAAARMIPLTGGGLGLGRIRVPGYQGPRGDDQLESDWNVVSPEFFETIGMRFVRGRNFTALDREGAPFVAIINETFARTAWPGREAVGQRFTQELGENLTQQVEIVGIVRDAKYRYVGESPQPFIYVPMAQQPNDDMTFFVRHAPGRAVAPEIRSAIAQVEPGVPIIFMQSFDDVTAIGLLPQRIAAWVAGSVGSIGVFLAALGLYGLMAFLVSQRTREIAIRMAMGASNGSMQAMVLKQAARLGAIGGVIGLVLAGAIGTLAQSLLVGVPPIDPVSFGGTGLLFAAVLAIACWTPARRAAATDPATALRAE